MLKQEAAHPYSTMAPSVQAETSCCRFCNARSNRSLSTSGFRRSQIRI